MKTSVRSSTRAVVSRERERAFSTFRATALSLFFANDDDSSRGEEEDKEDKEDKKKK